MEHQNIKLYPKNGCERSPKYIFFAPSVVIFFCREHSFPAQRYLAQMMTESKKSKRAKVLKKHANILMPKLTPKSDGETEDELENDIDNYEDSRIELRASGHNLVSEK